MKRYTITFGPEIRMHSLGTERKITFSSLEAALVHFGYEAGKFGLEVAAHIPSYFYSSTILPAFTPGGNPLLDAKIWLTGEDVSDDLK